MPNISSLAAKIAALLKAQRNADRAMRSTIARRDERILHIDEMQTDAPERILHIDEMQTDALPQGALGVRRPITDLGTQNIEGEPFADRVMRNTIARLRANYEAKISKVNK